MVDTEYNKLFRCDNLFYEAETELRYKVTKMYGATCCELIKKTELPVDGVILTGALYYLLGVVVMKCDVLIDVEYNDGTGIEDVVQKVLYEILI